MPEIECPSGLSGVIRKLKVREQNLLADPKKMRSGTAMDQVLSNVWESTMNSGPYDFKDADAPQWSKVLLGDYFFMQLELSRVTFEDDYPFTVTCRNVFCEAPIPWEVKLSSLDVQKLSDESREAFINGNRFKTKIEATGQNVDFRLLTGDQNLKMQRLLREGRDQLVSAGMLMQILEIEGVDPKQKTGFVYDMDADVAAALRKSMDAAGCGVETEIEVQCTECGTLRPVNLPFDGLFLPRTKRRRGSKFLAEQDSA